MPGLAISATGESEGKSAWSLPVNALFAAMRVFTGIVPLIELIALGAQTSFMPSKVASVACVMDPSISPFRCE
ncbi:hypothetical protein GCM10007887_29230 [Methylobacterium haplocladii]|uniref:Uncharacterized protein n=1 Tax=Methylobacterium haplocladii TaxID=1176176 RepID=A0A512IM43_9HYPH|nr:hypothetical protein MHA02_11750 [Methylobacterium haplocladii]GLS60245.1 hypothetical protein GCM10007887_29230 [Methylobacterium haplocladii]